MKLCIASTTKQRQAFAYHKIEINRLIQIPINHGDQMIVPNGTTEEVDTVVQHHQAYGLVDSTKVNQSQAFIGLCYDPGGPVSASVIEKAVRDNGIHSTYEAHSHHQASVAALDSSLRDSGTGYSGEMKVSAKQTEGQEDNENAPTVNETTVTEKTGSREK